MSSFFLVYFVCFFNGLSTKRLRTVAVSYATRRLIFCVLTILTYTLKNNLIKRMFAIDIVFFSLCDHKMISNINELQARKQFACSLQVSLILHVQ